MEVQVQAFAYATNDEINDMTFQRYKLINRAIEDIDSTYFAMWTDPDLGCAGTIMWVATRREVWLIFTTKMRLTV